MKSPFNFVTLSLAIVISLAGCAGSGSTGSGSIYIPPVNTPLPTPTPVPFVPTPTPRPASTPTPSPSPVPTPTPITKVYTGTAATRVVYFGASTTPQSINDYTRNVSVSVKNPLKKSSGSIVYTESNPINLQVAPNSSYDPFYGNLDMGAYTLVSADWLNYPIELMLQYWSLQLSGTKLTGTLVNPHTSEAAAWNQVTAQIPLIPGRPDFGTYPTMLAFKKGATLSGTVTDTEVRLHFEGLTTDNQIGIISDIVARR